MSREAFLERVRAALASSASGADAPLLQDPVRGVDPVATFIDRSRQVGVRVEDVVSPAAAAEFVAGFCAGRHIEVVASWNDPDLAPAAEHLRRDGVTVLMPGAPIEDVARAGLGLTGAAWGIAESATLVLPSGPDQPRLMSLLPPVHLAVLRVARILPDLPALLARTTALPSALTLVTGPSRSADIGFTPVLGAHGPTEVIVLLLQ